MKFYPGTRVRAFDPSLFRDDITTPLSFTMRPGTVECWYGYQVNSGWRYPSCIDVLFDHRPHSISHGHFTEGVEVLA